MKQFLAMMSVACLLLSGSAAFACDGHGEAASSEPKAEETVAASAGEQGEAPVKAEQTKKDVKKSKKAKAAKKQVDA
jgi:hypothetical protein